jgi:GNAT superfamily N-acetyltransferase
MDDEMTISTAMPTERAAALELAFSTLLPQPARGEHIRNLLAGDAAGSASDPQRWRGLLVARRRSAMIGVVWAYPQPGLAATLWPPRLAAGVGEEVASRLLTAALGEIAASGVKTAQALVAPADADDIRRLSEAGFQLLAELVYLMSSQPAASQQQPASPLEFQPYTLADRARLEGILDRTYVKSLDCPGLNGIRTGGEVLDEYQGAAAGEPAYWFFVRLEGADIGCLLLADHAELEQFELVYMALVPEARGQGRGADLVRYAQWLAARCGRQHLMLAVDSANEPALAMYEAAGMVAWDRRRVYLRSFPAQSH